jgi:hypothetical protein
MIQWDYKGEKGFGHVIEGNDEQAASKGDTGAEEDYTSIVDDGLKGSKFPRYGLIAIPYMSYLSTCMSHSWGSCSFIIDTLQLRSSGICWS